MNDFYKSSTLGKVTCVSARELSGPQLAVLYNELTGKTIKKFRDRQTGISKVTPILLSRIAAQVPSQKVVRRVRFNFEFYGRVRNYRQNTKRSLLIGVLSRPEGATFAECQDTTGWNYKVCYENIVLLHTYVGFGISEDGDGRIRLISS